MSLRTKLILEINKLPVSDLIAVQNFLFALSTRHPAVLPTVTTTPLDVRQALRQCHGELAEEIMQNREDRF